MTTETDLNQPRAACMALWLAGRHRDPDRLAARYGLPVEAVRQWQAQFRELYARTRARLMVCDLRRLRSLPAWERRDLRRRVLIARQHQAEQERRLRPWRVRAALRALEAWSRRKANRPKCGARCRDGHACRAPVALRPDGRIARRCRMHGGLSTGATSPEGRARALAALQVGNARWRARDIEAAANPEPGTLPAGA